MAPSLWRVLPEFAYWTNRRRSHWIVRADLFLQVHVANLEVFYDLRIIVACVRLVLLLSSKLVFTVRDHDLIGGVASCGVLVIADRVARVLHAVWSNLGGLLACCWPLRWRALVVNLVHVSHEVVYRGVDFRIGGDRCIGAVRGWLLSIKMRSCFRVEPFIVNQYLSKDVFAISNRLIKFIEFVFCVRFHTLHMVLHMLIIFLLYFRWARLKLSSCMGHS